MTKPSPQRGSIIQLFSAGWSETKIVKILKVSRVTVWRTIKRFKEIGGENDRRRSGRPVTVSTRRMVEVIRHRCRRKPNVSQRSLSRELHINRRTIGDIIKYKLKLKVYKMQKVQKLTDSQKRKRYDLCKKLLKRFALGRHRMVLWSDEKKFSLNCTYNPQNDRVIARNVVEANEHGRKVQREKFPPSVMVWGGICHSGKTPLVFIDKPTTVTKAFYLENILKATVLPWCQEHFQEPNAEQLGSSERPRCIFQQDGAPAHTATEVQIWCERHFDEFINKSFWPPNSPDLNPMDFSVWGVIEARLRDYSITNLCDLKDAISQIWNELDIEYLRTTTDSVMNRLRNCVKAKGDHIK